MCPNKKIRKLSKIFVCPKHKLRKINYFGEKQGVRKQSVSEIMG